MLINFIPSVQESGWQDYENNLQEGSISTYYSTEGRHIVQTITVFELRRPCRNGDYANKHLGDKEPEIEAQESLCVQPSLIL